MLEIARFEARRRLRGTLALSVAIALVALLYVALWPSMEDLDLDEVFQEMPPFFQDMFGIVELGTIEGFLASELYQFIWMILLGLYFAYAGASVVAGDVERERLDLRLSLPVTRSRLLLEEFLALLVPVAVLNVIVGVVVGLGSFAVGESIDPASLALAHLFSVPYLTVCIGIGLVLSVVFSRADVAQRLALGVVFVLWIVESVSRTVDEEWLGTASPSRYYDPTGILVLETVDWVGVAVLVAMTALLVGAAVVIFRRRDLT